MTHLFLVGDIFDLWVAGHFYFIEKFKPLIEELRRLHALGVEIHYFEGNHDLYLEHFFARVCGFRVHRQFAYFNLGEMRVRVEHGDEMDPADRGYRFLRWLLRTPLLEWLAPRLPDKFVVWLGQRMSEASRQYTSALKTISLERARDVIRAHALGVWNQFKPFDLLVAGHVHVVEDSEFIPVGQSRAVRVINLGSWFDGARALKIEGHVGKAGTQISWLDLG